MTKKTFSALLALVCLSFLTISCLGDDEKKNEGYVQGYFTITGSHPLYVLYGDNGVEMHPTQASVNSLTQGKGFGEHKRVRLSATFLYDDYTEGTAATRPVIKNAVLQAGEYMVEATPMSLAKAEADKVMEEDSLFIIENFYELWNGSLYYLNVPVKAGYALKDQKGIFPNFNLVYNEDDFADNAVTVTLAYNRHTDKAHSPVYYGDFVTSFPMAQVLRNVPGSNDSIMVTVNAKGKDAKQIKMKRP